MKEYLLTIGITSYNRVQELKRCLESIHCIDKSLIEILISEDKSPKRDEICDVVENFKKESEFEVVLNKNEINLGYDRNLKKIVDLARGKYVMFLSDDDSIIDNSLDVFVDILKKGIYGVVYAPFYIANENVYRRKYHSNSIIQKGEEYLAIHLYDSVLFSGLTFYRDYILDIDAERFLNKNYFQVYLFINCVYNYGGYYCNTELIQCIGDGVNGFGLSESSYTESKLADRSSVFSFLAFHKGLISVIRMFDEDNNTDIFKVFNKEYRIRSIVGLSIARKMGKEAIKQYWSIFKELDINIGFLPYIYYYMLYILGTKLTLFLLHLPKSILHKLRHEEIK